MNLPIHQDEKMQELKLTATGRQGICDRQNIYTSFFKTTPQQNCL